LLSVEVLSALDLEAERTLKLTAADKAAAGRKGQQQIGIRMTGGKRVLIRHAYPNGAGWGTPFLTLSAW
jgi:hypothetical protein